MNKYGICSGEARAQSFKRILCETRIILVGQISHFFRYHMGFGR